MPTSSSTQRARAALARLERTLTRPMGEALRRALQTMAESAPLAKVEAALRANDVHGAVRLIMDSGTPAARNILTEQLHITMRAGARHALTMGGAGSLVGRTITTFRTGSPSAIAALHRLDLKLFPTIFKETESVLRAAFAEGLRAGLNPRTVAVSAREYVGLTTYDWQIMGTMRGQLETGQYGKVLSRELRDHRFDKTLRKALDEKLPLTPAQIDAMTQRYSERLIKWRSETWSRTATLNAAREGEAEGWRAAAEVAGIPAEEMTKTWVATNDERTREEHLAADGLTVRINEEFPVDGGVMVPGEGVYNCRCVMVYGVVPLNAERRQAFFDSPSRQPRGEREAGRSLRRAVEV